MKKALFSALLLLVSFGAYSQWLPEFLQTSPVLKERNNNKLSFEMDATGFFKNNEYFSPLSKGQTFPGVRFEPKLAFQLDSRLRFELGLIGMYISGNQKKNDIDVFNELFARIQFAIRPNLHLIFGNLYGGANHRLIEPLYRWDQQLVAKPESGLQLKYENERYFADLWVDWRRYIEHGDNFPEILSFGLSTVAQLTPTEKMFQVKIPFQLTIYHQGGQIDTSDEKMIVMGNVATGIRMNWKLHSRLINSVDLDTYFLGYYDKHPNKELRPYDKGWAIYPVLTLNIKDFKAMAGYYHGHKFYSYDGDPLFSSFNLRYPEELHKTRQLITPKLSYFKQIHPAFSFGGQVEGYFDMKLKEFDYSFGVSLRVNTQLFSIGMK